MLITVLMYIFLALFCTLVPAALVWLIYRRVRFVVICVKELIQHFKKEKQ